MTVSEPMLKHPGHGDEKVHGRKGGGAREVSASDNKSAWNAVLTDEARSIYDRQEAHPERYNPRGADYGLKPGATELRVLRQDGPPRVADYETHISAGLTLRQAEETPGFLGMATTGDMMARVPVGDVRPPQHVYRVMSTQEFDTARERGYIKSDERMNLDSSEGTVTSLRTTGDYYAPMDGGDYRVVRIRYADEDGWRTDPADSYIKTDKRIPFERVDLFTTPVSQGVAKELTPVVKHPGHGDQKVHGRKGSGVSAAPAREGRRIDSAEDMDEAFKAEINDRALVPYPEAYGEFAGAMKMSIAERLDDRMKDVSTEDLVNTLSNEQQRAARYALDPESDTGFGDMLEGRTQVFIDDYGDLNFETEEFSAGVTDLLGREYAEIGTPMAEMFVRHSAVSNLTSQWATSSNDRNPASLAIQDAAAKEFGVKNPVEWKMSPTTRTETEMMIAQNGDVHRKFVRAQYDETQEMLASRGISEIVAYRGMRMGTWDSDEAPDIARSFRETDAIQPISMQTRPISSFSTSQKVAVDFAMNATGDVPIVIKATIPASSILSTCITGNGCWNEREITVVGDSLEGSARNAKNNQGFWFKEPFPVEKAVVRVNVDNDDLNADWIKTLSWDLPVTEEGMERSFGAGWRKKFERLPAWEAAPASLRLPAVVKFAPGLTPVLKHPGHGDQKVHGRKGGGTKVSPPNPKTGEEQHVMYEGLYVPVMIPTFDGSSVDNYRIEKYPERVAEAAEAFGYWEHNYGIRIASAKMMGLESGFSPKGDVGSKEVSRFLRGEIKDPDTMDTLGVMRSQWGVQNAVVLMDSTAHGAEQPTLYRGIRLKEGDPRLTAKVGDEFEMPVSAFATARQDAEAYAGRVSVSGVEPSKEHSRPVLIEVKAGARGVVAGDLPTGSEVLSQGRFRVAEEMVTESFPSALGGDSISRLVLEQVARYDVMRGEWVDNA